MATYNADKPEADQIAVFDESAEAWPQLNKLAFWMATGSGKTLLMHANILQYQHALTQHGRQRELNRILLLTPNEGLSQQHLHEFEAAGIDAELFNKDGCGLFSRQAVEILEVTRLRDEMGDRTIAIDAFEGNNLVLVDEGHRGASGGKAGAWMRFRNALCEKDSLSSTRPPSGKRSRIAPNSPSCTPRARCATTHTAISTETASARITRSSSQPGNATEPPEVVPLSQPALVLPAAAALPRARQHLPAIQHRESPVDIRRRAGRQGLAVQDASDIVEILQFLARYVADRTGSIQRIDQVLNQGLVTVRGRNLFAGRFAYLNTCGLSPGQVFDETWRRSSTPPVAASSMLRT